MRRVVAVVASLCSLMSCASPRNGLNTSSGSCFRALPAAEATVRHKGALEGVRRVTLGELAVKLPEVARVHHRVVCAVAFRASYRPGDVADADPAGPGSFAVVVLNGEGSTVLAAFVVDTLPIRFHHRA